MIIFTIFIFKNNNQLIHPIYLSISANNKQNPANQDL